MPKHLNEENVNNLVLTCTETVVFNSLNAGDITVDITGPFEPYDFDIQVGTSTGFIEGETSKRFHIKITMRTSLMGEGKETITVKFRNTILANLDGNASENESTSGIVEEPIPFLSEEEAAQARASSSVGIFSIFLTFVTAYILVVVLGQTIEASWLLLATIQMMSFVPLLNMYLPMIFREFSKHLAILHGEPNYIPNLFEFVVNSEDAEAFNIYFEQMNFKTMILVLNSGRKIILWVFLFSLSFISAFFYNLLDFWHRHSKVSAY